MSEIIYSRHGLTISQYIGPEIGISIKNDPLSSDRTRYQITNNAGLLITLSAYEWHALADYFQDMPPDDDRRDDCDIPTCSKDHVHGMVQKRVAG
jgi:hypothetical protein